MPLTSVGHRIDCPGLAELRGQISVLNAERQLDQKKLEDLLATVEKITFEAENLDQQLTISQEGAAACKAKWHALQEQLNKRNREHTRTKDIPAKFAGSDPNHVDRLVQYKERAGHYA